MIYRADLIDHFNWLAGSECFDEVLDEALVAIAMVAHGHGNHWVESGAAWRSASGLVEYLRLGEFVERARSELIL